VGKKNKIKKSSLLYQRLQAALKVGDTVQIETDGTSYYGIPIKLSREFVEIMVLMPPCEFDEEDDTYKRTIWLIQLAKISAIAYPTEYWSTERLDNLLEIELN
jgi:hypothetical protein